MESGFVTIVDLAPSAFLASTYLVKPLVAKLLTPIALTFWSSLDNLTPPSASIRPSQRAWDDAICRDRMMSCKRIPTVPASCS